jgi:hypothetical protein
VNDVVREQVTVADDGIAAAAGFVFLDDGELSGEPGHELLVLELADAGLVGGRQAAGANGQAGQVGR